MSSTGTKAMNAIRTIGMIAYINFICFVFAFPAAV